jgi:hypothetical protein
MVIGSIEHNPYDSDSDDDRGEDRPNRIITPDESDIIAAARLKEIHQYLTDRYARREVVTETVTPSGQTLDWVPIESQPGTDKLFDPPDEDRPYLPIREEMAAEPLQFELQLDGAEVGPRGTVPLVRKPIENIRPIVELNDWLAKGTRALREPLPDDPRQFAAPEDAGVHKYAATAQSVTCYGTEGNINAWDPYLEWSDEFSLAQLSLSRGVGSGKQTLEVGHQEYRDLYGDWVPHLFIFYTTNGYTQQGDNKGGYNQDVDGWVQYSNTIYPEALSSPLSAFGGTQYIMPLKVQLWQGNWWVRVNGIWIGYYPASLYNTDGLRNEAAFIKWYGEVVDSGDHAGTTATDMGNGHWPYEGWQHCAYMNNLRYQSSTGGGMSTYQATGWATHPLCYDVETHFNNTGSWGSYFWWGGSGRNSQCP